MLVMMWTGAWTGGVDGGVDKQTGLRWFLLASILRMHVTQGQNALKCSAFLVTWPKEMFSFVMLTLRW